MNDLISREETISYIENWKEVNKYYHPYTKNTNIPIDEVIQVIKDVPSNNQKTGHWEETTLANGRKGMKCSNCGCEPIEDALYGYVYSDYCPSCGAKMEGE